MGKVSDDGIRSINNSDSSKYSTMFSVILLFTFILGIPAASDVLSLSVPMLLALVIFTIISYLSLAYYMNKVLIGVATALFFFLIFNMDIPVYAPQGAPRRVELYFYEAFLLMIVVIGLATIDEYKIKLDRYGSGAVGFLLLFLVSVILCTIWSIGQINNALFTLDSIRQISIFVAAVVISEKLGPKIVLIPLFLSVAGNSAFSFFQVLESGYINNLTYMGLGGSQGTEDYYLGNLDLMMLSLKFGYYPGGFVGSARDLNALLIMIIPILFYYFISTDGFRRMLSISLLFFSYTTIVVSQSETAIISSLIGVMLSLIIIANQDSRIRTIIIWLIIPTIPIAIQLFIIANSIFTIEPLTEIINQIGAFSARLETYNDAINDLAEHPVLGIGGYRYPYLYDKWIHNLFIHQLVAVGIIGGLSYLLGIILVLYSGARKLSQMGEAETIFSLLLVSILAFIIYLSFTVGQANLQSLLGFWALAGVVVGAQTSNSNHII